MSNNIMVSSAFIGCGMVVNIWNGTLLYATKVFSGTDELALEVESRNYIEEITKKIQNEGKNNES